MNLRKIFFPEFEKYQLEFGLKRRCKSCALSPSEIMTLMIYFHQLRFRDFKTYYTQYVEKHLHQAFPDLVSYNRFVELMPSILLPTCFFIHAQQKSETGIYFTCHCLRRTFITIAESLDIPAYALKRLLNHKMNNDITAGYIIADVERLRRPMQQITDYLLKYMEVQKFADIAAIQPIKKGIVHEETA